MILMPIRYHYQANPNGGLLYYTFPMLEAQPWLNHACSTRLGGVSRGIFSSMNLGLRTEDDPRHVRENFRLFAAAAGFSYDSLTLSQQSHTDTIRIIAQAERGNGLSCPSAYTDVDGLATALPGITLVVNHADCQPLLFADPKKRVVGAVHAGWRGTAKGIGMRMVEQLGREYGCAPADILVGIGVGIGVCCYEVGPEVREAFLPWPANNVYLQAKANGKYQLNLAEANRQILLAQGVQPEHISVAGLCTACQNELFFSHRFTKGRRGSLVSAIAIR